MVASSRSAVSVEQRRGLGGVEHELRAVLVEERQGGGSDQPEPHVPVVRHRADGSVESCTQSTVIDGDIVWTEHPDPVPGPRELLVAVRAAGLNGADMLQRRGLYAAPPDAPADIPGLELAGEVVATGPAVEHFVVGDRVMAVVGGGGQAELAVVHERTALRVPDGCLGRGGWLPRGVHHRARRAVHPVRARTGERCWSTARRAASGLAGVQLGLPRRRTRHRHRPQRRSA